MLSYVTLYDRVLGPASEGSGACIEDEPWAFGGPAVVPLVDEPWALVPGDPAVAKPLVLELVVAC